MKMPLSCPLLLSFSLLVVFALLLILSKGFAGVTTVEAAGFLLPSIMLSLSLSTLSAAEALGGEA